MKPRKQPNSEKSGSPHLFGITRQEKTWHYGHTVNSWVVDLRRQGQGIRRAFLDHEMGGKEASLALAIAWREAVMRLIPPTTKRQVQTMMRFTNTSGVTGVSPWIKNGVTFYWTAALKTSKGMYRENFSIKRYGNEKALELATRARQRLLEKYGQDSFLTTNKQAEQVAKEHFENLLFSMSDHAPILPSEIDLRLQSLNLWFDNLKPRQVYVRVAHYHMKTKQTSAVQVRIQSIETVIKNESKYFSTGLKSYAERLPEIWQHIRAILCNWYGESFWQHFCEVHHDAFMEGPNKNGFWVRHYSTPLFYPQCLKTPSTLQALLGDFQLPVLEFLPAVEPD